MTKHVSGEPQDFGDDYEYYDENCEEQALYARLNNLTRARDIQRENARQYREQAERFEALSAKYARALLRLKHIARKRGLLDGAQPPSADNDPTKEVAVDF